ncbi:uncharacterized protein A1O5_01138 [Cladophialophora psammophila CBS 110553]|uniref:Stress-response A/B barrel domain-containing protein n=1 Tax=Cladophialophora psammophila CBS 110553 TaxID=1182543 RepID=W9XH12_9EURO|nr:uncharacterized protein A1O5_01138 [Cladophialophora psammophila CBS 110553]EXJ76630.1 hypothetical protein A1O5_01138 [Cladophialophora psammophila CBS 110553]
MMPQEASPGRFRCLVLPRSMHALKQKMGLGRLNLTATKRPPAPDPVLFKTKPGVTEDQKQAFVDEAKRVTCLVPGVISLQIGPALDMERTKGYNMGIFLTVDKRETIKAWAINPEHLK